MAIKAHNLKFDDSMHVVCRGVCYVCKTERERDRHRIEGEALIIQLALTSPNLGDCLLPRTQKVVVRIDNQLVFSG